MLAHRPRGTTPDNAADVAHILRRLTFAAHPDRLDQFARMDPTDVIDAMLSEDPLQPDPPELGSDDDSSRIQEWWLKLMGRRDAGLHEKMVWFWHGHFTSSLDKVSAALMMRQHLLIRKHALGNFRDLLREMSTDAAMLYWLDGAGSTSDAPNQNFAREVMELFTLGREGSPYTEDDVRAGAVAFSGWWVDGDHEDEVRFDPETGPKRAVQLLGATIGPGHQAVADAVDALVDHPSCAGFVAAKIDAFLTGVEPDAERRRELAHTFTAAGMEIRPLVERIVRDPAFMQNHLSRPRSAVEWFVAVQILLGTEIDDYALEGLGQVPFYPPNVAGWPGTARWVSAGAEFAKAEIAFDNADDTATLDESDPVADVLARAGLFEVSDTTVATLRQATGAVDGRRDTSTGAATRRRCCTHSLPSRPSSRWRDEPSGRSRLPTPAPRSRTMTHSFSRRDLVKWAGVGAGAAAIGGGTWLVGRDDRAHLADVGNAPAGRSPAQTGRTANAGQSSTTSRPESTSMPPGAAPNSDLGGRMLVVVELDGGNDGHSTLVPYGLGEYYDARSRTAVGEADVIHLSGTVGLHKNLSKINRRGVAVVQGLGSPQPDESHFEMLARWWTGDPSAGNSFATGFLGRLADAIGDPAAAAVAVSIGAGSHPALIAARAATLCLTDPGAFDYLTGADPDDVVRAGFQRGFASYAAGQSKNPNEARVRAAKGQSIAFAQALATIADVNGSGDDGDGYPGSTLGNGLRLAAQLLDADLGVRIVHVPMQEDFDTHDDHSGRHPGLLQSLDDSLDAFLADLDRRDMSDRVLVMTTSEFGRSLRDNGSDGLDHGTASVGLLLGPVNAGLHGELPSLTKLSDNDEPIATVSFDQYYATVAEEWFGVPAGDVLHGNVAPLAGIVG